MPYFTLKVWHSFLIDYPACRRFPFTADNPLTFMIVLLNCSITHAGNFWYK